MKFSVRSTLKDVEPISAMIQNIFADCYSFVFSIHMGIAQWGWGVKLFLVVCYYGFDWGWQLYPPPHLFAIFSVTLPPDNL
jgi:hypothetical protein